jgi:hypothetical protein
MGIFLQGYFICQEIAEYEDGTRVSVVVAVGANTYRIYMCDDYDPDLLADEKVGEKVTIRARPYVNKKSRLVWVDGEVA